MKALICEGYNYCFDENACEKCGGKCCTGESGYIWINEVEIKALSKYFEISVTEFIDLYLEKYGERFSIKEKKFEDGFACVFFDEKSKNCGIYDFRPSQCRTFPFWEYYKKHLGELKKECIGVKSL